MSGWATPDIFLWLSAGEMGGVCLRGGCRDANEIPEDVPITPALLMLAPVGAPYSGMSGPVISAWFFRMDRFRPF